MAKRIGLVQTGGIGDIIIALPIADHFTELGFEVVWPIKEAYMPIFEPIKPSVRFLPVPPTGSSSVVHEPLRLLNAEACQRTIVLYSYVGGININDSRLSGALKFDEYKYAIAGVPFAKKWDLRYERDMERENRLYDSLNISEEYLCFHGLSADMTEPLRLPGHMSEGLRVIEMEKQSEDESPFDWLLTLERAKKLILVDSCFANLVEQMNLTNPKAVITDNAVAFTPVFRNGWQFLFPDAFKAQ
ncbi:MAG TPA: hypothetical protein VGO43_13865 [Pyrinomonadaceae bacterium]|jgi:hypothetical protein|nr:hypothetical protein [Pyrinomonadaceae bacterium]